MDALLTQRHVARAIVDEGGDYVMIVKENQPQLRADIELVLRSRQRATVKRPHARWTLPWAHRAAQSHDQ